MANKQLWNCYQYYEYEKDKRDCFYNLSTHSFASQIIVCEVLNFTSQLAIALHELLKNKNGFGGRYPYQLSSIHFFQIFKNATVALQKSVNIELCIFAK
uniref:Uncharacterized protein n=1 Tax=Onchocerca volvulus TaxID=6282 RepID=A0A8R1Y228_ONCVO